MPVAKELMQSDNEFFFFRRDVASLNVWPQIIQPSQSATLPTSFQTCRLINPSPGNGNGNGNGDGNVEGGKLETDDDFFLINCLKKKSDGDIALTSSLRKVSPFPFSMDFNIVAKDLIFPSRP